MLKSNPTKICGETFDNFCFNVNVNICSFRYATNLFCFILQFGLECKEPVEGTWVYSQDYGTQFSQDYGTYSSLEVSKLAKATDETIRMVYIIDEAFNDHNSLFSTQLTIPPATQGVLFKM